MPNTRPTTVPELFDALGGNVAVANALGKGASTISEMRRSRSISVRYWPQIIKLARDLGVRGVTSESMMMMCARESAAESAR